MLWFSLSFSLNFIKILIFFPIFLKKKGIYISFCLLQCIESPNQIFIKLIANRWAWELVP